jgi:hypothetical protein
VITRSVTNAPLSGVFVRCPTAAPWAIGGGGNATGTGELRFTAPALMTGATTGTIATTGQRPNGWAAAAKSASDVTVYAVCVP